ncbi:hypothetical protein NDU88_003158 [Pleurodeles waltl]|uniref:Uncharacterized protein n=1 Tax=Pleurodeles waltl TaxID=8319 RepID=A0AAV7PAG6_PLEWA|nr:hypothetical protein NDU88_003158 [Pleurodeles waltl]
MEHYTTLATASQRHTCQTAGGCGPGSGSVTEEPSRAVRLAAIQGTRTVSENKIKTVDLEVNLLRTDLCKVSDKVQVADDSIGELQTEVDTLRKWMAEVSSSSETLEERMEDVEGQVAPHNVRLLGLPEQAEKGATEQFI